MGNRVVNKAIFSLAEVIGGVIRNGRPIPTSIGCLAGGIIGAAVGFIGVNFILPGVLVGLMAGAMITAPFFPKPPKSLDILASDGTPTSLGKTVQCWDLPNPHFATRIALLDHGLYVFVGDDTPWEGVLEKLEQGKDPDIQGAVTIHLSSIQYMEVPKSGDKWVTFYFMKDGRTTSTEVLFHDEATREDFIRMLELSQKHPLETSEEALSIGRSTLVPAICSAIALAATCGVAMLSAHWIANPPPPPQGKMEQDELVRLLVWAQPKGVGIVGGSLTLLLLAWVLLQIVSPPKMKVLRFPRQPDQLN